MPSPTLAPAASPASVPNPTAADVRWHRPLPGREASDCVEAVTSCLDAGRRAIVLVPEADPLPATGRAVLEAFGERAVAFVGAEPRERYRTWLRILAGHHDVVVGSKLARVLTGGHVSPSQRVTEQQLLDLEREAFVSLCGEVKTQERMQYMLMHGKPLRN